MHPFSRIGYTLHMSWWWSRVWHIYQRALISPAKDRPCLPLSRSWASVCRATSQLHGAALNTPHIAALSCNFYGNFTFLWICWTLQNCAELNREKKPQVPGAGRGAVAAGGSKSLLRAGFQSKYMFQIFSIQTHLNLHIFEFDLNNALNYCQWCP